MTYNYGNSVISRIRRRKFENVVMKTNKGFRSLRKTTEAPVVKGLNWLK